MNLAPAPRLIAALLALVSASFVPVVNGHSIAVPLESRVADQAGSGYVASSPLGGVRVTDPELVTLAPFEVSEEKGSGCICCGSSRGTEIRHLLRVADILERDALDDSAPRTLEEAAPFTTETQQTAVNALFDGLPIAAIIDPATVNRIVLHSIGVHRAQIAQERAGRFARPTLTLRQGDEGFMTASARVASRLPGSRGLSLLGIATWTRGPHEQAGIFLEGEKALGEGRVRATAQARELDGYGSTRFVRGSFARRLGDDLRLEATVAWHALRREDPTQFRLNSPAARYEGLGLFNLDTLTAETKGLDDMIADVQLSGIVERFDAQHQWSAHAGGHRQEADWFSPLGAGTFAGRRDNRTLGAGYHGAWMEDRLEIDAQVAGVTHRTPRTTIERGTTRDYALGASWALHESVNVFGTWTREMSLPWLPSGRWQSFGANRLAVSPDTETREGLQAGVSVNPSGSRLVGLVAVFREDVLGHTYRDWSWERSQSRDAMPRAIAGELRGPVLFRTAPDFSREGLLASLSFTPSRSTSLKAMWSHDWADAGPYRGGNRHASVVGRHVFRYGTLRGLTTGFALNYRNALRFDDGYILRGGLRADLMLSYRPEMPLLQHTLLQLNLANVTARSWQPTRFAPDYGRQVLLSVAREF